MIKLQSANIISKIELIADEYIKTSIYPTIPQSCYLKIIVNKNTYKVLTTNIIDTESEKASYVVEKQYLLINTKHGRVSIEKGSNPFRKNGEYTVKLIKY